MIDLPNRCKARLYPTKTQMHFIASTGALHALANCLYAVLFIYHLDMGNAIVHLRGLSLYSGCAVLIVLSTVALVMLYAGLGR